MAEPNDSTRLHYYACRALNLVQALNAFDGGGIPSSDAQDAFSLLRELSKAVLGEHNCGMGYDAFRRYRDTEEQFPQLKGSI